MPVDRSIDEEDFQDDEKEKDLGAASGSKRRFKEFECPDCSANNPIDESFGNGEEITCNYCGTEYKVVVNDDGKLKLKST
jgi:DNA-directed RNA polymerase subunit RPC12/RpoP